MKHFKLIHQKSIFLLLILPFLLLACGKGAQNQNSQLTIKSIPIAEIQSLKSDESLTGEVNVIVKIGETECLLTLNEDATLKGSCDNIPLGIHNYSVKYYFSNENDTAEPILLASSSGSLSFEEGKQSEIDLADISLEHDTDNDGYSNIKEILNKTNPEDDTSIPREVKSINIDKTITTVEENQTLQLNWSVMDNQGQDYPEATIFFSSSDETIASISENGEIQGQKVGSAKITVKDTSANISDEIEITIIAENQAPQITSPLEFNINENNTAVSTISVIDENVNSLTFSISGTDANLFTINPDNGILTFNAAPDFEGPDDTDGNNVYLLDVNVSDGDKNDTAGLTITISNIDEPAAVPPVINLSESNITVAENTGTATLIVTLGKATETDVMFDVNTMISTATVQDFTEINNQTITIPAGIAEHTININITDDVIYEGTLAEVLNVELSNVKGAMLGSQVNTSINITDNEKIPTLSFTATDYNVTENVGSVALKISASHPSQNSMTIDISTIPGTASSTDFTGVNNQTITIPAGSIEQTLNINITDDTVFEGSTAETFSAQLGNVNGASLGTQTNTNINIIDNETFPSLGFSSTDFSVAENDGSVALKITASHPSQNSMTIDISTTPGTASSIDFTGVNNQTITIPAGSTEQTLNINITDDTVFEGSTAETFSAQLGNVNGASLGAQTNTNISIIDNETLPSLSFSSTNVNVAENAGLVAIEINANGVSQSNITVEVSTVPGTATSDDYTPISNQLVTISATNTQQSFNVIIKEDNLFEGETAETFSILLGNVNGATLGTANTVIINVSDNDPQPIKPTAIAGLDQLVKVDTLVTLDGTASRAVGDTTTLNFLWTPPAGITLSGIGEEKPMFTTPLGLDAGTTLTFSLVVTDSKGIDSDPTTVDIIIIGPQANAGQPQNAVVGDTVILDASDSSDPLNESLSYLWTAPPNITLSDNTAKQPSFIIPIETKASDLQFELTVDDGKSETSMDSVIVTVLNSSPIASINANSTIFLNQTINLDASPSTDMNGDELTFTWRLLVQPNGSSATINNSDMIAASFQPDVLGNYTIELEVNDGISSNVVNFLLTVVSVLIPEMIAIPSGTFDMGDIQSLGKSNELPVHTVTVAPFEMSKYEVTFEEYDQYLKTRTTNPISDPESIPKCCDEASASGFGRDPKQPVINVSWDDVQVYLDWLNTQLGIPVNDTNRYRLPSEAEWEYAARAGTNTAYPWGNTIDHDDANYGSDICCGLAVDGTKDSYVKTAPVGMFAENAFDLFDMHGNLWEWVEDCYGGYDVAPTDGSAQSEENCIDTSHRIARGGAWINSSTNLRSAYRAWNDSSIRINGFGFRIARTVSDVVPIANPDFGTTTDDQDLLLSVLDNDQNLINSPISISIEDVPIYGNANISDDKILYSPTGGIFGTDTFNYRVTDNDGDFSIASVSIDVSCSDCVSNIYIDLSWSANPPEDNVLGYNIYFDKNQFDATTLFKAISVSDSGFDATAPNAVFDAGTDFGLKLGDSVCFKVAAYNITGELPSTGLVCSSIDGSSVIIVF